MPWTFAHPAAVLPLRRFCPRWLSFPALLIGSLTPDFGYYLHWLELSRLAHRFPDGLPVCLLSGLLLLALFYLLRRPVCELLPQPHRGALLALIDRQGVPPATVIFPMVLSLAIGAITHMAWDGLTHRGGWTVVQVLSLQEPVFRLWGTGIPAYQFLQQLSTLVGTLALAWMYVRWLRLHAPNVPLFAAAREDRWRYRVLALSAALSMSGAFSIAAQAATRAPGRFSLDVFMFRWAVDTTTAFVLLCAMCAVILGARRSRAEIS